MLVLGIESSCDETAAAVVEGGRRVLSNVIASQHDLHAEYGGVVPEIASRAHVERLLPVLRQALREAQVSLADFGAVAVGNRPGLIGSLLVGVAAAKALAWALEVPIVGVDHVQAHLYAGMLEQALPGRVNDEPRPDPATLFPALGLVVSGGHSTIFRCDSPLELTRLGSTIDDAIGEAYDKVAAMLGLGHPGGPVVDALAGGGDERAFDFPISRLAPDSLNFSFSGLKTSVLYALRGFPGMENPPPPPDDQRRADVCASFQRAAVGAVLLKLERALESLRAGGVQPRALLIGGGVSANTRLRRDAAAFALRQGLTLSLPAMAYCLDNAAMIAGLGYQRILAGQTDDMSLQAIPTPAR
jgi:N6-L-threonylcarbamoyladenine synthase